jgi:hypothetical protein
MNLKFGVWVAFLIVLSIPLVLGADMWIKIYSAGHDYGASDQEGEVYNQPVCKMKDGALTHCNISHASYPCGKEGPYYAATFSDAPNAALGIGMLNAHGQPCDGIPTPSGGPYGTIYNCTLYTVDYDRDKMYCEKRTEPCFNIGGIDGGVWEDTADNSNGECCGDDPSGPNPTGTDHTIDDPDMGKKSCENCTRGLFNITIGTGPGGGLRDWSNAVINIDNREGCCGDDYNDCLKLLDNNRFMCWDFGGTYTTSSTECDDPNPENCAAPTGQTYSSGVWHWTSAGYWPAKILAVSCAQETVVSDGSQWIACENISFSIGTTKRFAGNVFQTDTANPLLISDHQYLCYFDNAPTIAECCGGTLNKPNTYKRNGYYIGCNSTVKTTTTVTSYGGVLRRTGENVVHDTTRFAGQKAVYYCTSSNTWATDLDASDKYTCEQAQLHYTGHYCCSEADDQEEFYNDVGGSGVCINKTSQDNNKFVNYKNHGYTELYVFNGQVEGCAISEAAAGPSHTDPNKPYNGSLLTKSNDWLLGWKDFPDSRNSKNSQSTIGLVHDNQYCAMTGTGNKYFCSYREVWLDDKGKKRNHLSFIAWTPIPAPTNPQFQYAECCNFTECWDGTQCVDSFHTDAEKIFWTPDNRALRCEIGNWVVPIVKYNWDRELNGYCPDPAMCLVDPTGKYENNAKPELYAKGSPINPQCVNNGQFIQDHYCDNGNWSTRTRMILMQLLDFAGNNDFTLFCDSYAGTLNYYHYSLQTYTHADALHDCQNLGQDENDILDIYLGKIRKQGCRTNCTEGLIKNEINCANNFCVLQAQGMTLIGVSLNQALNSHYYPFLDLLGKQSCSVLQDNQFHSCGDDTVWYNSGLQSVIFSTQTFNLAAVSWWDVFINKIRSWTSAIVSFFASRPIILTKQYPFVTENPQMNRIYMERRGSRQVFAVVEENMWYGGMPNSYLSVTYDGFNTNICHSFAAYPGLNNNTPSQSKYRCERSGTDTYKIIADRGSPVFNLWHEFTAKLRVK